MAALQENGGTSARLGGEAIRAEHLTKRFGAVAAVDQLSLSVAEGELFGLVGPDGAGKTTIMRMLSGILSPTSGMVFVSGVDVANEPDRLKDQAGYMSQRFGLYQDLTVTENIEFYADLYGVARNSLAQEMARLLDFSGLSPFKRRRAGNLSGGMKQKLGLCCALIHTPKVLLLDEPTNGVDPVSRRDFWRILGHLLSEKVTIFVSTAYLDEAERCDRVGFLHKGKLLACGTPGEVKKLVEGAMLEIRCADARRAAAALKEASVGRVALYGDRVHLLVPSLDTGLAAAEAALSKAGIAWSGARQIEPSLEDVFTSSLEEGTA